MEHRGSSFGSNKPATGSTDGPSDSRIYGRSTARPAAADEQHSADGRAKRPASAANRGSRRERQSADSLGTSDFLLSTDLSESSLDNSAPTCESSASEIFSQGQQTELFPNSPGADSLSLLRELTTGVVLLDADGCVTWMNASAEDVLGLSFKRAANLPLATMAPGLEELGDLCRRARQEQKSFGRALNILSSQRDVGELELAVRVSLMGHSSEEPLLLEFFDITQRHQLARERNLIAQHGASRQMLRQLAHEIRNPLGGLRGAAQLLERELPDPSLREFTQVIIGEADRLAKLMDNLLGPGSQPNMQQSNLHEQLERVATIVESEWPTLKIVRDYDPSLPELYIDRDQITQALLNLLRNASQATQGCGNVIVRTRVLGNQILNTSSFKLTALIEVEDDGPGVPEEIADTLFYPLVTGRPDGTGLGLPLAQDLVNRHRGLIEYESEQDRTVFMVHLPIISESVGS